MTARELEQLMERQFGPDWRDKTLVGPTGVWPLRGAFEECGLRDPREPELRFEPLSMPPQIVPLRLAAADLSPEANIRAALRYMQARYGVHLDSGRPAVAGRRDGDSGAARRQQERDEET